MASLNEISIRKQVQRGWVAAVLTCFVFRVVAYFWLLFYSTVLQTLCKLKLIISKKLYQNPKDVVSGSFYLLITN